MNVFLIGYMGCGKSTIGDSLAKSLGYKFIDLDDFIEKSENRSITEIFEKEGEAGFRGIEQKHLQILKGYKDLVISTGGGTPCFYNNMASMNEMGITVYLEMNVKSLCYRLENSTNKRPLIKGKSSEELLEFVHHHLNERLAYYDQSKITVNAMAFGERKIEELAVVLKGILK